MHEKAMLSGFQVRAKLLFILLTLKEGRGFKRRQLFHLVAKVCSVCTDVFCTVFRHLRFAVLAYSHHLCLSLCVRMCVTFCENVCCHVAKILKENHLYGFKHFQSNGASSGLLLLGVDLHFQGNNASILLFL